LLGTSKAHASSHSLVLKPRKSMMQQQRTGVSHLPTKIRLNFNKTQRVDGKNELNLKF
jgi:hypothetical protein